jgi:N-acetyl-alpha-D-glucosaminyl L-malate synthase BshA
MKIGIVCYPSIGGSGIVATELGKSLSRNGHQVHFFSYDIPRRLEDATEKFHFHHVDVPLYPLFKFPPYTLALASSIYQTIQEHPLDVVHVHYAIPHCTSAFLAKRMLCQRGEYDLKVITTLHGTDTELVGLMPLYKPVVEFSIDSSDAVTTVSEYLKKVTLEQFEIHKDIRVVYNLIDTEYFSPPAESERFINREKKILHISNFRPVKRISDVVKVFDLIASSLPAKMIFVGDGPERPMIENLVERLGLIDKVEFLGPRMDINTILKQADLLLCTSESETFGMTIAEAMACGVPVVSSNVGGVPEVVVDNQTGFLTPLGCIQSMAEASIRILADKTLQKKMGDNARQRILDNFHISKITSQYEDLYLDLINNKDQNCGCPKVNKQTNPEKSDLS